ncbi:hypothetical protein V6N13_021217 [Hibiscus sabdariffa]
MDLSIVLSGGCATLSFGVSFPQLFSGEEIDAFKGFPMPLSCCPHLYGSWSQRPCPRYSRQNCRFGSVVDPGERCPFSTPKLRSDLCCLLEFHVDFLMFVCLSVFGASGAFWFLGPFGLVCIIFLMA